MSVAAAVIDVGWVNGLAAIRSLGRAGIRVLAVDHRPSALGFRSQYAERFLSPDPFADERRFVNFVRALGEVVVFPTHDDSLNAIAKYADDLEVLTPFPAWDVLERAAEQARAARDGASSRRRHPGARPTDVPGHRQARPSDRVQAALQAAGVSLRDAGGARRRAGEDRGVRRDRAGIRPRRRRHALHRRQLHRARREAARRLLRPQAAADAAGHRHVPRRRGRLGAGGRRRRAASCSRRSTTTASRRSSSSATRATAASS